MAWRQQNRQTASLEYQQLQQQVLQQTQAEVQKGRRGQNYTRLGCKSGWNQQTNSTKQGGSSSQIAKQINTAICNAASNNDVEGLLSVVASRQAEMSCVNVSTAWHKLARMAKEDQCALTFANPRISMMHVHTEHVLKNQLAAGTSMPRCWATIAWAYATLQLRDSRVELFFELIGHLSLPRLREFKTFELTNLLWSFAKQQMPNRPLFLAASQHIVATLLTFSPSNLSTIVWALVTAKDYQPSVLHRLTVEFARRFDTSEVNPVELSNMMWGLATAKVHPNGTLLHEIGMRAIPMLDEFKVQELSITAWAFSRLGTRHDQFFSAASIQICKSPHLRQQMHSQGIANLLWAFERQETLGAPIWQSFGRTLALLIPTCQNLLTCLKPQEFTCVFRALGKLGLTYGASVSGDRLLESASSLGMSHSILRKISASQCVDLLEAYARFMSGSTAAIPEVCQLFTESLVQTGLEKASQLAIPTAIHFVVIAAALLPRSLGEAECSGLLRLALQLGLESFSSHGQKLLAHAYGSEMASKLDAAEVRQLLQAHLDSVYTDGRNCKQTVANICQVGKQMMADECGEDFCESLADTSAGGASDQEENERQSYGDRPSSVKEWSQDYEDVHEDAFPNHFAGYGQFGHFPPTTPAPPTRAPQFYGGAHSNCAQYFVQPNLADLSVALGAESYNDPLMAYGASELLAETYASASSSQYDIDMWGATENLACNGLHQASPSAESMQLYRVKNTFVELDEMDSEMQQVRSTAKAFRSENLLARASKFAPSVPKAMEQALRGFGDLQERENEECVEEQSRGLAYALTAAQAPKLQTTSPCRQQSGQLTVSSQMALQMIRASLNDEGGDESGVVLAQSTHTGDLGSRQERSTYIVKNTFIQFPEASGEDGLARIASARFASAPMQPVAKPDTVVG